MGRGDLDEATRLSNLSIATPSVFSDDLVLALNNLAVCYMRKGDFAAAEALAESDRALFLDPNLAGVRRQRELIEQRLR